MYFDDNGLLPGEVSDYFERGAGQQYIVYAEDYLTLDEGRDAGGKGVLLSIPPADILFDGSDLDDVAQDLIKNRSNWKRRAHLLPVAVPRGTQQLSSLSVDRGEIVQGVREGFATAFDLLAPSAAGVELDSYLDGSRVANLLFPDNAFLKNVLDNRIMAAGRHLIETGDSMYEMLAFEHWRGGAFDEGKLEMEGEFQNDPCPKRDAADAVIAIVTGISIWKNEFVVSRVNSSFRSRFRIEILIQTCHSNT